MITWLVKSDIRSIQVGAHGGQGVVKKVNNILGRAFELRKVGKSRDIDVAVSHNSYAHYLAAKLLGIPYITIMDYEYQPANHINFRLADKIMVPFTFRLDEIRKYGATARKLIKYPGLKEEVYLWQFRANEDFWQREFPELDLSRVMCTVRPPATMAAYHDFENPIFHELLRFLLSHAHLQVVFFARTEAQRAEYQRQFPEMYIAAKSVNGAQLIAHSDLVISAGGTMNREAAVLGTPAYTVYAGKMGSADKHLNHEGKVRILERTEDLQKITLQKKSPRQICAPNARVFEFVMQQIEQPIS